MSSGPMLDVRCPRCGGGFECGVQAGHCACFGIRLPERLRVELAERYSGCLCMRCLGEIIQGGSLEPVAQPAPASR